ncbi:MAG: hypothetical protein LBM20_02310 [Rikenellaceae bacterium]|jgi:Spy/CpxP family protein refolding chaperone|nr:hypothetical protein [Rikenellaceae bacterium]
MKKVTMMLCMLFLACAAAVAQPPQGGRPQGGPQGQGGQPRFGVNLDEIPEITADQKTKVQAELTKQMEAMRALFEQGGGQGDMQANMQKMQELHEKTNQAIAKILTKEQFKVYTDKEAEMMQRMMGGGPGGF